MKVLVTGANGFVGSAVVQELLQNGHEVIGWVRSKEAAERLQASGATAIRGSITDTSRLQEVSQQVDTVIHTAFFHKFSQAGLPGQLRIMLGGSPSNIGARFMQTAVGAEQRAIEAFGKGLSAQNGALIIALPTMTLKPSVVGQEAHAGDPYSVGGGRVASEQTLKKLADHGVRPSLVRLPPIVYGANDYTGLLPSLIKITNAKSKAAYVADGNNHWANVHRLDAAKLFVKVAEQTGKGSTYHAVGHSGVPFREIAEQIAQYSRQPLTSLQTTESDKHFSWLSSFVQADNPVSSEWTRKTLDWQPQERSLAEEMEYGHYFEK
ncbi:SDR family oxidoreductase [Saccharibacillus sp. JS10]|uniref:SDR family oxidoreductase n=1 Tax=Saccharibacillus sp. JS10 TaxID=2950552 RepID=UPI00210EA870|nr:SDR family oxidoreductase [Saccharibacillus sp. JS10]MCQ4086717.1 SDR family oxidoreductase [Saccharibacillus sp. JS10]